MSSLSSVHEARTSLCRNWAGWLLHALLLLVALAVVNPVSRAAGDERSFNIAPQRADKALIEFARQAQLSVLFPTEQINQVTCGSLRGTYRIEDALDILLHDTGITAELRANGVLTIKLMNGGKEQMNSARKKTWLSLSSLLAALTTPQVYAQTKPAEAVTLEEIIVTAQKRTQNLQDVPISVSVLSGEKITDQNFSTLQDLSRTQPALSIYPSGRAVRISLRGVASGTNPALDQSVVTFIDDIYHGKSRASGSILLDIDRIEILKGPQTTYFGNNAIGGAINVQTAKPTKDLGGSVRALYGSHGEYAAEAIVNIPVTDTLAMRGAILANGLDGYLNDRTGGGWAPHERNVAGRISALWSPTSDFQLNVKAEGTDNRNKGGGLLQMVRCPPAAPFTTPGLFCPQALSAGADVELNNVRDQSPGQFLNLSTQDYQATATYDFGAATLTSVSAYSHFKFDNTQDNDTTPLALFGLHQPQDYSQFSQELRLASDDSGPLSYIVGVYYQPSRYKDTFEAVFSFLSPAINASVPFAGLQPYLPFGQAVKYTLDEETTSAFGSLTWRITDALSLTGGLRGSSVKKDIDQVVYFGQAANQYGYVTPLPASVAALGQAFAAAPPVAGVPGRIVLSRKDRKVMPTFNAQYKLLPDISVYASYTAGFKAGGFNGAITSGNPSQLPYSPEKVKAYEVGLRSEWLDRRLLLNVSGFRSEYTDLQVSINAVVNGSPIGLVQNAASEVSQGVEIESKFAVTKAFAIGTSMTFLDATYGSYPNAPSTSAQRLLTGSRTQDLSGQSRIFAPKFSGTLYATYKHSLTDALSLELEANLLHQSSYFVADGNDPFLVQPAYNKLDLRAAISSIDSKWEVSVIGKNVTDQTILTGGLDLNGGATYILSKERPRSFAAQLRYKW